MAAERAHPDLNQGPADLQSAALATELCTLLLASQCPYKHVMFCTQPIGPRAMLVRSPTFVGRGQDILQGECSIAHAPLSACVAASDDPAGNRAQNFWFVTIERHLDRKPTPYPLGHRVRCSLATLRVPHALALTRPVIRPRQNK